MRVELFLPGAVPVVLLAVSLLLASCLPESGGLASLGADSTVPTSPDELVDCLLQADAIVFGTEWCPACRQQEELFGPAFHRLEYVDCDVTPLECAEAGVRAVPSWEIHGRKYVGVQPLSQLAIAARCQAEPKLASAPPPTVEMPAPTGEITAISYSWRDAKGTYHVTSDPPPPGAREVSVFR